MLVADIARTYDILGWLSPTIIKAKTMLQRVWEAGVDWDSKIPQQIIEEWSRWRADLAKKPIERCYFPKDSAVKEIQLHGIRGCIWWGRLHLNDRYQGNDPHFISDS